MHPFSSRGGILWCSEASGRANGMGVSMATPLIALVDDTDEFIEIMREVLIETGYRVVAVTVARDVEAVLARERPDLLVLDVVMEERESGWELARAIRANPTTTALPVIVCSADAHFLREHRDDLRALHCEVLPKPFDLDDLLERIAARVGAPSPVQDGMPHA